MQLSRDTKRFLFSLSVFTVALVLCVINFSDVGNWLGRLLENFSPFIIGGCIAFILSVPMSLFNKLLSKKNKKGKALMKPGKRKLVSLLLSILFVFLLIGIFSGLVVPQIIITISALADSLMNFVSTAQLFISDVLTWLEEYPEIHDAVAPVIPDLDKMASTIINVVQRSVLTLASTLPGKISSLFGSVKNVIISFVFAVYVLLQTESLSRQCKKLVYAFLPKRFCDDVLNVARLAHKTFFSYVAIQCTEAAILSGLCFLGMLIFRFPHALVISVIMLFGALIPIYGAIFSCVIGAFLVLIESPMKAIGFVLFILILQQIETNLIYPRVVSTAINLPSMWVLLAVTVGGGLFGIPGMMTAVPIVSITYTLLGDAANKRLSARGLSVYDPAPPTPPEEKKA